MPGFRPEREPRDEADAVLLGIIKYVLALPVDQIVPILHRRHFEDLRRRFELGDEHFAQAFGSSAS